MANKFDITISAVDRATAVLKGVQRTVGGISQPIADIGKSAAEVGGKLGVLTGPMSLIGGASSIAGIAALASEWGRLGIEVSNAASGIGMSSGRLRSLQGLSSIAGASSEAMASSLHNVGQALNDAQFGRNTQVLPLLAKLGIGIHRTSSGAIDSERALRDLAGVMPSLGTQTQNTVAQMLGVEQLLPVLRQGGDAWDGYAKRQQELRPTVAGLTEQQRRLGLSLREAEQAVGGIGDALAMRMIPRIQPVIDQTVAWIAGNRDTAATLSEVASAIGAVAMAARFLNPILATITAISAGLVLEHEHEAEIRSWFDRKAIGAYQKSGLMPQARGLTPAQQAYLARAETQNPTGGKDEQQDGRKALAFFQSKGYSRDQAAGIVANLHAESNLHPFATGDQGRAYGIGQWHPDRQRAFAAWAGHDIKGSSLDEQLGFVDYEMNHGEKGAGNRLRQAKSAAEAGAIVSRYYERPADTEGEAAKRGAMASAWADIPAGSSAPLISAQQAQAASKDKAASAQEIGQAVAEAVTSRPPQPAKVELNVSAPPGTAVKSADAGGAYHPTSVNYSMPSGDLP